jgi:cyclohexanecarboxylate-CoA ligase
MRDLRASLTARVAALAERQPREPAVVSVRQSGTSVWSWAELWQRTERTAAVLAQFGVRPGEVVAYQLANRAEFVALTLGVLRIGAICCPLMPIFRERELASMLALARARVVVVAHEFHGRNPLQELRSIEPQLPLLEHVLVLGGADGELALPRSERISWHSLEHALDGLAVAWHISQTRSSAPRVAQLLFTSGTSGEPKAVLHRDDALMRAVAMQIRHLRLDRHDRIYVPSPLAHQTGFLYGMWLALALGVTQIVQERWDPRQALAALDESGATFVQAATPFLADLVEAVERGAQPPATLRIFVATGAAVPRTLARRATGTLRAAVCGAFGTTEGCLATLGSPDDPPEKAWGTDGRALAGVELRIRDDAGNLLGHGEEGLFETRSPTMFAGYLDHPEWTAAAYTPDGWYRTGDLAFVDHDGFLHLTGRVRDVINRGGEKIPVAEIEQLLHQHGAVKEVAIVAMPDPRLGERACAFVVRRDGGALDLETLRAFLDERRVAKPYWPERLELLEGLPRTPSGKIQKFLLRERARSLIAPASE